MIPEDKTLIREGVHANLKSDKVLYFVDGTKLTDDVCKMIYNGITYGLYEAEDGKIMAEDIWGEHHVAERDVAAEAAEINKKWFDEIIHLEQIDGVLNAAICGNYDVERDFLHDEKEGSVDNGIINVEFTLVEELQEEPFETKVKITAVYPL